MNATCYNYTETRIMYIFPLMFRVDGSFLRLGKIDCRGKVGILVVLRLEMFNLGDADRGTRNYLSLENSFWHQLR